MSKIVVRLRSQETRPNERDIRALLTGTHTVVTCEPGDITVDTQAEDTCLQGGIAAAGAVFARQPVLS